MPEEVCQELEKAGIPYSHHTTLDEVIDRCDILYMTRIQKERFEKDFEVEGSFVLTPEMLTRAKEGLKILHPLPRVNEIAPEVDTSKHAYYFEQAENGLYVRQALLCKMLGES